MMMSAMMVQKGELLQDLHLEEEVGGALCILLVLLERVEAETVAPRRTQREPHKWPPEDKMFRRRAGTFLVVARAESVAGGADRPSQPVRPDSMEDIACE